ncbi:NlpC/P60 family protein [Neobacillus notoginsengisoli]|uniref:NlpC/P60 family protein n=1 Tax=Neobacillus notoginsengisoli TaxID=1578198 RepID=A0A417YSQ7_9BACI|nr:C40 family peptidase [Neobacillus notoginsengisoli]RHW39013.1 NlpC/P60 family protein [Neobacillus notoginsengisoli]
MTVGFRISKGLIVWGAVLALAISMFFAPFTKKAEASVSWGQEVTEVAKRYMGTPYKWGGTTAKGFDASGYTQFVYKKSAAKISLPRISKDQYKVGESVAKKDLKEGDLVFFKTNGKDVSFVGIYLGKNKFIAVTTSKGVSVQSMDTKYWKDSYVGAKRVLKQ